jgi:Tol biopolymer transport system component
MRRPGEGRALVFEGGILRGRPWLRAWLVVGLAAWATLGVLLVARANTLGLIEDITFSPYHLVGYAALATLAGYVAWSFFRGLRRGGWRTALPPLYGSLGIAFVLLVAWVVLDPVWDSTLGIRFGIEGALAPTRLLIPVALVLLAIGPVREAIAERAEPGLRAGEVRVRWAGVVGSGLVIGAATMSAFNPVTSPVNDWAYLPGSDRSEIWIMNADGSSQTRVLAAVGDGVDYSLPAWSPDGSRIAYTVWKNDDGIGQNIRNVDQTSAIWTMNADGTDRRLVVDGATTSTSDPKSGGLVAVGVDAQAWIPAWSPDGQWIAYTLSPQSAPAGVADPQENVAPGQIGPPSTTLGASIWIVRPDGTDSRRVSPEGSDAVNPVWSPDGRSIAFSVGAGITGTDIRIAPIPITEDGLGFAVAADAAANDWGPSWSPDGSHVLFVSNRTGNDEVWSVGAEEDATPAQLTDNGAGDWVPVYSPDGSRIAFVSERTGEPEIWTMAPDGSDLVNVTDHPQHWDGQWSVAWSPDGSKIAYGTGSFPDARASGWAIEDVGAAQSIIFGIALSLLALLLLALGAPLGSFTVALTIVIVAGAFPRDQWQFIPAAIAVGLILDGLVRSVRQRWRTRLAAAALPGLTALAIGLTIGASGSLAWSLTLLLGVALASTLIGWGIAEAVTRLLPRPAAPEVVPPDPA